MHDFEKRMIISKGIEYWIYGAPVGYAEYQGIDGILSIKSRAEV